MREKINLSAVHIEVMCQLLLIDDDKFAFSKSHNAVSEREKVNINFEACSWQLKSD